jgi:6-pyruvoyltetrahydropterin/6-carboxytetrahydropterin synthase
VNLTVTRRVAFDAVHFGRKLSYALEVSVTGPVDEAGSVIDFHLLRDLASGAVADVLASGAVQPPTAERLVTAFWHELAPRLPLVRLTRLRLWETPNQYVEYDGS